AGGEATGRDFIAFARQAPKKSLKLYGLTPRLSGLTLGLHNVVVFPLIKNNHGQSSCRDLLRHQARSNGRKLRRSRTFSSFQTASQSLRARDLPRTGAIRS